MVGGAGNGSHTFLGPHSEADFPPPPASCRYLFSLCPVYFFLSAYHYLKLSFIVVQLLFYSLPPPPPEYKLENGNTFSCSLLYCQYPEQDLAHTRYSKNIVEEIEEFPSWRSG